MNNILLKVWKIIPDIKKIKFINLILLMIVTAILETITIILFGFLLTNIVNPNNRTVSYVFEIIGNFFSIKLTDDYINILLASIIFCMFIVASTILKIIVFKKSTYLSYETGAHISALIYQKKINLDYLEFKQLSSSYLIENILNKTSQLVTGIIMPFLLIWVNLILLIFTISLIVIINPLISLLITILFLILFKLYNYKKNKIKTNNSNFISKQNKLITTILYETYEGIRDIIIFNNQKKITKIFNKEVIKLRNRQARNTIITLMPKFYIEAGGLIFLIFFTMVIVVIYKDPEKSLPIIGVIAFCIQKLLPVGQQLNIAYSSIQTQSATMDYFYNEFITNSQPVNLIESSINKIDFIKINLVDVTYFYDDKNKLIFENTNLEINAGNKVAIIGDSGIGKSTLLDLLSGLIYPKEGNILINNEILTHSNRKSWINSIAYVPQTIFLRNASIYENIGIIDEKIDIDYKKIYECAKIVDLHNFFINLSDGYNTILGENGIEISGGQRQRIGIARALYSRKKIIILDEATNSIDKNLQEKILENLLNMNNKITLIFNTHQTEIINKFDRIFKIKNKKIIEV